MEPGLTNRTASEPNCMNRPQPTHEARTGTHKPELSGTAPNHEPCEPEPPEECVLSEQEDMSSCSTRRHVFLLNRKTCALKAS